MNLMYITSLDVLDSAKCGIRGKLNGQMNAMKKANINVHFGHFYGNDRFVISFNTDEKVFMVQGKNTRSRFASIYDRLMEYVKNNSISVVYIRFTSLDAKAIKFYKNLKKNNVKVIIEFYSHNLELEAKKTVQRLYKSGEFFKAFKGFVSLNINKFYFKKLKECIDLIVTTTEVEQLYGVPTINVVNGIDTSSVLARKKRKNEFDFNIISVAMISSWHGYDRVIRGISDYYKNGGKLNILYNVIGDGEEKKNLESLVSELGLEEHVVFPGIKLGEELNPFYENADIALEMLAGFRRTKGQISSIKMAEYFAKGIPVIFAADENKYSCSVNKYCYRVTNDDSNISIQSLINFSNGLKNTKLNVEENMHKIAEKEFDWTITMSNLIDYILCEKINSDI